MNKKQVDREFEKLNSKIEVLTYKIEHKADKEFITPLYNKTEKLECSRCSFISEAGSLSLRYYCGSIYESQNGMFEISCPHCGYLWIRRALGNENN